MTGRVQVDRARAAHSFATFVSTALALLLVCFEMAHAKPPADFTITLLSDGLTTGGLFRRPFDVVSADLDRDGDPDLLINWHHIEPLELFENREGQFIHLNPVGNDSTGLYDNAGIENLFVDPSAMSNLITASGKPGLYIWHDLTRTAFWRMCLYDPRLEFTGARLDIETTLPITGRVGFGENTEIEHGAAGDDGRHASIAFETPSPRHDLGLRVRRNATELYLELTSTDGAAAPPIFVGSGLSAIPPDTAALSIWKPDPHGIAWVNVRDDPRPEIFIAEGGLGGELAPPARPRADRFYIGSATGPSHYTKVTTGMVPASYGRGRRVEWVDANSDGQLEVSISGEGTPTKILGGGQSGAPMIDIAEEIGINGLVAPVQAWGDFDDDGRADLFYLSTDAIDVQRALPTGGFERIDGKEIGLAAPPVPQAASVIQPSALHFTDYDNDGDLDLWLVAHGRSGTNRLYRREPDRYTDVTTASGIGTEGTEAIVFLDSDNDGDLDVVSLGKATRLWRNQGGGVFEVEPLAANMTPNQLRAATVADFDGDGRLDIFGVGKARFLLQNRTADNNRWLDVELSDGGLPAIGAVATAVYSDGSKQAQRLGSAASSAFSQTAEPLHFGIAEGIEVTELQIRWPRDGSLTSLRAPGAGRRVRIDRRDTPASH